MAPATLGATARLRRTAPRLPRGHQRPMGRADLATTFPTRRQPSAPDQSHPLGRRQSPHGSRPVAPRRPRGTLSRRPRRRPSRHRPGGTTSPSSRGSIPGVRDHHLAPLRRRRRRPRPADGPVTAGLAGRRTARRLQSGVQGLRPAAQGRPGWSRAPDRRAKTPSAAECRRPAATAAR